MQAYVGFASRPCRFRPTRYQRMGYDDGVVGARAGRMVRGGRKGKCGKARPQEACRKPPRTRRREGLIRRFRCATGLQGFALEAGKAESASGPEPEDLPTMPACRVATGVPAQGRSRGRAFQNGGLARSVGNTRRDRARVPPILPVAKRPCRSVGVLIAERTWACEVEHHGASVRQDRRRSQWQLR